MTLQPENNITLCFEQLLRQLLQPQQNVEQSGQPSADTASEYSSLEAIDEDDCQPEYDRAIADLSTDPTLFRDLAVNHKVYNAFYDLAVQMYEAAHDHAQKHPQAFEQSMLYAVLKQGRIVIDYASFSDRSRDEATKLQLMSTIPEQVNIKAEISELTEDMSFEAQQNITNIESDDLYDLSYQLKQAEQISVEDEAQKTIGHSTQEIGLSLEIVKTTETATCDTLDLKKPSDSIQPTVKKMPHFQIPNARVGQTYQSQIKLQYPIVQDITVRGDSIKIPEHLGISFDEETQQLHGVPTQAGDFKIYFQYKTKAEQTEWLSADLLFIITADPASLWQMNEPSADEPYAKPHTCSEYIITPNFSILASSIRGRSHEHAGTFRDDDYFIQQIPNSNWSVMIVADGAGSATFSREGSKIAVEHAGQVLVDYVEQQQEHLNQTLEKWQIGATDPETSMLANQLGNQFRDIFYQAAEQAVDAIEQEAAAQQTSPKAFSTTLLAAVVRQLDNTTFVSTFWVGDGAIAVYAPDRIRLMGKPDGGEFAGQTRFLDRQIIKQFGAQVNIGYYQDATAVILMTDGISDPRFETDAGLANEHKWHDLWQEISPQLAEQHPDQSLLAWLRFFSKGHHDDRTLAILWSQPQLKQE